MISVNIQAYPFATQNGWIDIPDWVEEKDVEQYIIDNWDHIDFGEAELDYAGCDYDLYLEHVNPKGGNEIRYDI